MTTNKGTMSEETFRKLMTEDYWVKNVAKPVKCCDKFGKFSHYRTCTYPNDYIVTDEQIEKAGKLFEKRKQEELASIGKGVLAFVAMGEDFEDINHRFRCDFCNSYGEQFFIEFSLSGYKSLVIDFSIDRQLEQKYEKECEEQFERNAKLLWKDRDHRCIPQYYNYAKGVDHNTKIPATWDAVLEFVNKTYGCNYKSTKLLHYFVMPEDYVCHC